MKKLLILLLLFTFGKSVAQNTVTVESGTNSFIPQFRYKAITPDSLNHLWIVNPVTGKANRAFTATEINQIFAPLISPHFTNPTTNLISLSDSSLSIPNSAWYWRNVALHTTYFNSRQFIGTGNILDPLSLKDSIPTQTLNSGKVLGTDGTNLLWVTGGGGGGTPGNPSGLLTFTPSNGSNAIYLRNDGLHAIDSTVVASLARLLTYQTKASNIASYQPILGFTPENVANKATSFSVLNNTLYPTTQAVQNLFNTATNIYNSNGTIPGGVNRVITLANGSPTQLNIHDSNGNGLSVNSISGLAETSITATDAGYNHYYSMDVNGNSNSGVSITATNINTNNHTSITFNDASAVRILDENTNTGIVFQGNYTANQRLNGFSVPSVNTVRVLIDSVKSTISGGTVTNPLTVNNSGTGAASPFTFDGSAPKTISYNSIGAQAALVSGTTIKTVNSTSLLGSGDIPLVNIYNSNGAVSSNRAVTLGAHSLTLSGTNVDQAISAVFDNTSGGSSIIMQATTNNTTTEHAYLNMQAGGGTPAKYTFGVYDASSNPKNISIDNASAGIVITDQQDGTGIGLLYGDTTYNTVGRNYNAWVPTWKAVKSRIDSAISVYSSSATGAFTSIFGRTTPILVAQTGDYNTSQVTENTNLYFTNARVIAAPLTGYTSGAGTVAATDNVLQAIQKINGNVAANTTTISGYNSATIVFTNKDLTSGTNTFPTFNQSTTGNAATVTNGVYTSGVYLNPAWLTGVPYSILTGTVPTWNQNTSGTAANLSGTPALPNGTTATTQTAGDNSTKLSTTAYADNAVSGKALIGTDNDLTALQALGSTIKGLPVGQPLGGTGNLAGVSGTCFFTAIYLATAQTLTGVVTSMNSPGVYTGNNYNGIGLYSYSGGTLTLVASSTTNSTIWTGSNAITTAFSSTYSAAAGIYYIGTLYSSSAQTTAPTFNVVSLAGNVSASSIVGGSNKFQGLVTGKTALPTTVATSTFTTSATVPYCYVY